MFAAAAAPAAAAAAAPRVAVRDSDLEAVHPLATSIRSGRLSLQHVHALKHADTPEKMTAAVSLLAPLTTDVLRTVLVSLPPTVRTVVVAAAPNSQANSGSRLDRLLAEAVGQMQGGSSLKVQFLRDAFVRIETPTSQAKHRPDLVTTEEAETAAVIESKTVRASETLVAAALRPDTTIVIIDDTSATGVTLASLSSVLKDRAQNARLKLVALHTMRTLAGTAIGTLTSAESQARVDSWLEKAAPTMESLARPRDDRGGSAIYVRAFSFQQHEGTAVANAITRDFLASGWERRWATSFLDSHKDRSSDGRALELHYTGQVHTPGKTCATRWGEEDSGADGTGLVNQLRLRFGSLRGVRVAYTSRVVFDSADLAKLATAGVIDSAAATDAAEAYVAVLSGSSYKEGGANCITPGPISWKRSVDRLRTAVAVMFHALPHSGNKAWRASAQGVAALKKLWGLRADFVAAEDDRILAHVEKYFTAKDKEMPTARELESAYCAYASEWEGRLGLG